MTDYYVGQKVVCIDNSTIAKGVGFIGPDGNTYTSNGQMDGLKKNSIYTIKRVIIGKLYNTLILHEITRPKDGGYAAKRFRPLVETKSEVSFTMGADPDSEKWDNRKVKVK